MNQDRYSQLCRQMEGKETEFTLSFMEMTTMLGAIRLMQDHPDFQVMGIQMRELTQGIRQSILDAMLKMGVPVRDVHALNVLYASESGGSTFTPRADGHLRIVNSPAKDGDEDED